MREVEQGTHISLEKSLIISIIEMQAELDKSQVAIKSQDYILNKFFGDFKGQPSESHGASNSEIDGGIEHEDYSGWSIGKRLNVLPFPWDGDLEGLKIPRNWNQLMKLYKFLGRLEV